MDRARRFGSHMAWNPAGKRELLEESFHSFFVLRNIRINLTIRPLQVSIGHQSGSAVSRSRDINHIQVMRPNHPVEMHVNKVQSRRGAPVTQEPWFDVLLAERFLQQRIVVKINLPYR